MRTHFPPARFPGLWRILAVLSFAVAAVCCRSLRQRRRCTKACSWSRPTCSRTPPPSRLASRSRSGCACRWRRIGTPTGKTAATPACRRKSIGSFPTGFKAGPLQWPIPTRIDSPGDIVNYGYSERGRPAHGDHAARHAAAGRRVAQGQSRSGSYAPTCACPARLTSRSAARRRRGGSRQRSGLRQWRALLPLLGN